MELVRGSERIIATPHSDPSRGRVVLRPAKALWIGSMTLAGVVLGPLTFSWSGFAVFLALSALTLCAGHSVGMHRRLIHNSFACPIWLEYILVYLGVLVGMAGPLGMIRQHDVRDWAQRQSECHDYLRHGRPFWLDGFWQLYCDLDLDRPPRFELEERLRADAVYAWMERTWMLQQAPLGLLLFALGGWPWVIWGVAVRVTVSVTGHWLVGYFAHNDGPMSWQVRGACVQGKDVPIAAVLSMGESWHNNHHAYPGSAKIGILPGQPDPGWLLIKLLEKLGLAWDIVTPDAMPLRRQLVRVNARGTGWSVCLWRRALWRRLFGAA